LRAQKFVSHLGPDGAREIVSSNERRRLVGAHLEGKIIAGYLRQTRGHGHHGGMIRIARHDVVTTRLGNRDQSSRRAHHDRVAGGKVSQP